VRHSGSSPRGKRAKFDQGTIFSRFGASMYEFRSLEILGFHFFSIDRKSAFPYLLELVHINEESPPMTSGKRPRGRPRGSGKNDSRHLVQVADLLVREPSLAPTAAMTRIMRRCKDWDAASEPALIRRWQVKWKQQGEVLLDAARDRARPAPPSSTGSDFYPSTATNAMRIKVAQMMGQGRRIQEEQQIRDLIDPPSLRALREQEQRIRDLVDPPSLRALREQEQRMMDLIDPPVLRALREGW
jgi:hypothetical protein